MSEKDSAKWGQSEKRRARIKNKKNADLRMKPEQPCPFSKERRDSTHLRKCTKTGEICHDAIFLFGWKECHVFLENSKDKT